MKLVRFSAPGKAEPACGVVVNDEVAELEGDFFTLLDTAKEPAIRSPA